MSGAISALMQLTGSRNTTQLTFSLERAHRKTSFIPLVTEVSKWIFRKQIVQIKRVRGFGSFIEH